MKLIGITGKARSGKDTVAKYLWAQQGFTRIALADPLKLATQQIFGLTHEQTWEDELKHVVIPYWGVSPRQMFQLLGTEATKPVFGEDVWCKRWRLSYETLRNTDDVICTDIRFDIEAEMIRSYGGVIVQLLRGDGLEGADGKHRSESGLSLPVDFIIDNNGTLDELYESIEAVSREI